MTKLCMETELGNLTLELYEEAAPASCAHFMAYVSAGYYDGACFYRSAKSFENERGLAHPIDVIEGGYYDTYYAKALSTNDFSLPLDGEGCHKAPRPCISVEPTCKTGLSHVDGTLSFGRNGPDSVDDQFFICVGDQPELDHGGRRDPDGRGFSAFGQVVEGFDVVRRIHRRETEGQKLKEDVKIVRIYPI